MRQSKFAQVRSSDPADIFSQNYKSLSDKTIIFVSYPHISKHEKSLSNHIHIRTVYVFSLGAR